MASHNVPTEAQLVAHGKDRAIKTFMKTICVEASSEVRA